MKLSIIFFAASAVLLASANPLLETPSVRGPSQSCKDKWTTTVLGLPFVTTVAKSKLAAVAIMQMLQLSYWFTSSTATLQLNIDAGSVAATGISGCLNMGYPATQVTYIQGYFTVAMQHVQFSVNAVMGVNAAAGQAMQTQMSAIQANITAIVTQMQSVAASASIFSSLMTLISESTLVQLTATCQAVAQIQNDAGVSYSDSNSASNIPALLMDIVIATTSSARQAAVAVVQATMSATFTATVTAVQAVTVVQTTAMQQTSTVANAGMTTVNNGSAVVLAVLIVDMQLQQEFDVNIVVDAVAELEEGNSACTEEVVANITETNTEFTEMCSNTTDSDELTAAAEECTQNITIIMESQASMQVQMCATIALSAVTVEQTKGHQGIGQCVSEGKHENDKDMADVQQNYTASVAENQQNLTTCANKYKDPNYSGKSAKNTDSGANKDEMLESCKRVIFFFFLILQMI